jgi:hypothetical protein
LQAIVAFGPPDRPRQPLHQPALQSIGGLPGSLQRFQERVEILGVFAERAQGFLGILRVSAVFDLAVAHPDKAFLRYRSARELGVGSIGG